MQYPTEVYRHRLGKILGPAKDQDLLHIQEVRYFSREKWGKIGILCLHGFPATPASLLVFTQYFSKQGYSVACPCISGFGTQPSHLIGVTWYNWLQTASIAYDELSAHCDFIFIIAQSMGAALALQLALQKKKLLKIYLLNPAIYPPPVFRIFPAIHPLLNCLRVQYLPTKGGDIKAVDHYELGYKKIPVEALAQLYDCMRATMAILSVIKIPVLIFNSRKDHVLKVSDAEKIYQQLGSSEKKLQWVENSYHALSSDNDANLVLQTIVVDIVSILKNASFVTR